MLKLNIIDTTEKFQIQVLSHDNIIYECGYHGGHFQFNGEWYVVLTPYQYRVLPGGLFRLIKLNIIDSYETPNKLSPLF